MSKHSDKRLVDIVIVVLISTFVGMLCGVSILYSMNLDYFNKNKSDVDLGEIGEVYDKIVNEYYGTVDEDKLAEAAISGMLSILDKNTTYLNEADTKSFNNRMQGEYYGIGVEVFTADNSGILVMSVLKNSPAEAAGILEGDFIIAVDGESLIGKKATYFNSIISNSKNSVKLTIERNKKNIDISLTPEKIIIESVSSNIFYRDSKKVGYIKIDIFAANTASQFIAMLNKLEENGIDSLIIDVRNNAGGYLSNVATILELFMNNGTTLYKIETKESTTARKDITDDKREYPVVVLVNGSSASASEILAACFKENKGSDIVGTKTYGKGTVQEQISVLDNSMAKITTKKWLTPNGNWIDGVGVEPTIKVELNSNYLNNPTYNNDNQLETAINVIVKK